MLLACLRAFSSHSPLLASCTPSLSHLAAVWPVSSASNEDDRRSSHAFASCSQQQARSVSTTADVTSPHPDTRTSTVHVDAETQEAQAYTEELRSLLTPMPVGKVINSSLHDVVVELNSTYFIDPTRTLDSTMRVLNVVKQVLSNNGYVSILNSNPAFQPLMQQAALHCTNANVFWHWQGWRAGMLKGLADIRAQPLRRMLQSRGVSMVNVHCLRDDPTSRPQPTLDTLHKWRLLSRRSQLREEKNPRQLLREIVSAETQAARLPLEGALTGKAGRLQLLVVLDLSHGQEAIQEAYNHGILTASVVNAHTPLDRVTYPIYAGEGHPSFQHFFLDWLLKVVNTLTPKEAAAAAAAKKQLSQRSKDAQQRRSAVGGERRGGSLFQRPASGGYGTQQRDGQTQGGNARPAGGQRRLQQSGRAPGESQRS